MSPPAMPRLRQPRAVLFDLDGVLVNSFEVWRELLDLALERYGGEPLSREQFAGVWGQSVREDAALLEGVEPAELEQFYAQMFPQRLERIECEAGARELLEALAARGVDRAVVTNAPRRTALAMLERCRLLPLVEQLLTPEDVARPKPWPDMLLATLDRLGRPAAECVLVGDSEYDLAAGRAAQITVIGLRFDADLRVESLAQLQRLLGAS